MEQYRYYVGILRSILISKYYSYKVCSRNIKLLSQINFSANISVKNFIIICKKSENTIIYDQIMNTM